MVGVVRNGRVTAQVRYKGVSIAQTFENKTLAGRWVTAVISTAPSNWTRRAVANTIFNHLGKPAWDDPAFRDLLGNEIDTRTYFALADDVAKEVYIGSTRRSMAAQVRQLLSCARQYMRSGYCNEGPCDWIASTWGADRAISVYKLEVIETVTPHFSRNHFSIREDGFLGPRPEFIWSYVAHRAGYSFAQKNWYDKWIPEEEVDRPDVLTMLDARTWPATPVRVAKE